MKKNSIMRITKKNLDELTFEIIGCAIEVHRTLGPGLLEKVYERCLKHELELKGFEVQQQQDVPVRYKGVVLDATLKYDLLVNNLIIVEVKAVEEMYPVFEAQLLTYLRLLEKPKGILINFNCKNIFYEGQKTMVNELYAQAPSF